MAAKQVYRLFTSMIAEAKPNSYTMSEYSPSRLICSSAKRFHVHKENQQDLAETLSEEKDKVQTEDGTVSNQESQNEEDGGKDGSGNDVNRETGEIGGPKGPEPTRYGDWERGGRCSDF
ncbi:unnamed protein product [Cuscuta epithymum]|uniref:Succinate dehydrogenase assembly factor 4, mitochondrial n=1 Tax=Cuscuta epithymum TaxID=186058 RepID=A0AAV0C074_9ASTE|nr:unnamed protein product [Cuscuta epithymum]CAH9123466.1 unnamed protein product [Cuscuta epithymum]